MCVGVLDGNAHHAHHLRAHAPNTERVGNHRARPRIPLRAEKASKVSKLVTTRARNVGLTRRTKYGNLDELTKWRNASTSVQGLFTSALQLNSRFTALHRNETSGLDAFVVISLRFGDVLEEELHLEEAKREKSVSAERVGWWSCGGGGAGHASGSHRGS